MTDEYKKKIGIPESHTLNILNSQWTQRKGQDTLTPMNVKSSTSKVNQLLGTQ